MMSQRPKNEAIESDALRQYEPTAALADITRLAAYICGTPRALLCLIDGTRQSFNLELPESYGEVDFWAHAIVQSEVLVVRNTVLDVRFANNPIVTGAPNVRFYAGAPLIAPDGHAIGALCVFDSVPRSLTPQQIEALQSLSRAALAQRELHRHLSDLAEAAIKCRQMEGERYQAEREYLSLLNHLKQGIFIVQDGLLAFVNQAFAQMLGYTPAEMIGMEFSKVMTREECNGVGQRQRSRVGEGAREAPAIAERESRESTLRLLHKEQKQCVSVTVQVARIAYQGKHASIAIVKDISPYQPSEPLLLSDAFYDVLTGVLNQAGLMECLGRAVERAKQEPDAGFAVLILDIDRFKMLKHSLGSQLSELLLVALARRMETCLRPRDRIARIGSDEFALLLHNITSVSDATDFADILYQALETPFHIDGKEVFVTLSTGIVTSRQHSALCSDLGALPEVKSCDCIRSEDILRDAGIAMYTAKTLGKGNYQVFDRKMSDRALGSWQLEIDLRRIIREQVEWVEEANSSFPPLFRKRKSSPQQEIRQKAGEGRIAAIGAASTASAIDREAQIDALVAPPSTLFLNYQPIVSLDTGKLAGFEALVRWHHPTRGLISPAEFIPVAEETGLIVPLGAWVLQEACRQMRFWQEELPRAKDLTIAVNLSARQLAHPDLISQIDEILQQTGIDPSCLKLEITESVLVDNADAATAVFDCLRARNIQLCIDDFGTGYSSLSYLRRFPINILKIDRSFVMDLLGESLNSEIVRAIVSLAHNLGMQVVAEGIETQEQMVQLWALQCEYGQGYFFAKPLDSAAADATIAADPQW